MIGGESMTRTFDGKVAIITGAGTGIGAAVARDLGSGGCRVVLVGRRRGPLDEQCAAIEAAGGTAVAESADVRDYAAVAAVVERTVERFGRIDIFVANAAVADFGPIDVADPGLWRDVIETNVLGVLYGVRAALPVMKRQGAGHVVIVSSGSGRVTYVGEPAYVASKHATVAFADCLRLEVAPAGIRVAVIEPGLVETPLIHVYPEANDLIPGVTPLEPEDVARAIHFVLEQPPHCNVFEVLLRPTSQLL
jgi:NADP-dependent 3-hydroxy acid dehydrogenase YdfG